MSQKNSQVLGCEEEEGWSWGCRRPVSSARRSCLRLRPPCLQHRPPSPSPTHTHLLGASKLAPPSPPPPPSPSVQASPLFLSPQPAAQRAPHSFSLPHTPPAHPCQVLGGFRLRYLQCDRCRWRGRAHQSCSSSRSSATVRTQRPRGPCDAHVCSQPSSLRTPGGVGARLDPRRCGGQVGPLIALQSCLLCSSHAGHPHAVPSPWTSSVRGRSCPRDSGTLPADLK